MSVTQQSALSIQQPERDFEAAHLFLFATQGFHDDKNYGADGEVHQESPIFLEQAVMDRRGQVRHEKEVNRIAGEHGYKRVEEVLHGSPCC